MSTIRLRYIHRYKDRHGRVRFYLRRPGAQKIPLPGAPGTPEFMAAYHVAVASSLEPVAPKPKVAAGSMAALSQLYFQSAGYLTLGPTTRKVYQRIVLKLIEEHGHRLARDLDASTIRRLVAKRADTPAAANHLLRILRLMMRVAVDEGLRPDNPTVGVERLREKQQGVPTWSEGDIRTFEGRWPSGSKPRLALALLLNLGQRRSDIVRLGPGNIRDGKLEFRQVKGAQLLRLPILPELATELAFIPKGQKTYLLTAYGEAFTPGGFYNWFVDRCEDAGLPAGRAPHGLRKAQARRLAEAGASTHEIASVTGHKTLAEVQRYTRAAEQEGLADAAMDRLQRVGARNKIGSPKQG